MSDISWSAERLCLMNASEARPPHRPKKVWTDELPPTYVVLCERDGQDWPCASSLADGDAPEWTI